VLALVERWAALRWPARDRWTASRVGSRSVEAASLRGWRQIAECQAPLRVLWGRGEAGMSSGLDFKAL